MKFGTLVSLIVIFFVFLFMVGTFFDLTSFVQSKRFSFDCERTWHEIGERNVVLRIDDIQAFVWRETQMKMIDDILKRNRTVVLGVIPGIHGGIFEDEKMSDFLRWHRCDVEIAVHGYEHIENEFGELGFLEAEKKIVEGMKILRKINEDIVTFIPPNNMISGDAVLAVESNGIGFISANSSFNEYGFSSSAYNWEKGYLESVDIVLSECRGHLDEDGLCVIMFHPQNYVDSKGDLDEDKYSYFLGIISRIGELNASVVTFRDLEVGGSVFLD